MRKLRGKKALRLLSTILLPVLLFVFASCATWEGRTHKKQQKPAHRETAKKYPSDKEVKRPDAGEQQAMASSPARTASLAMVTKGKEFLGSGEYDKALNIFQEAALIDSGNGVAYYYMAKTRFYLGQFEEAVGILDKAGSLLGGNPDWSEAIALLKDQIEAAYNSGGETKDTGLIPIINRAEEN